MESKTHTCVFFEIWNNEPVDLLENFLERRVHLMKLIYPSWSFLYDQYLAFIQASKLPKRQTNSNILNFDRRVYKKFVVSID